MGSTHGSYVKVYIYLIRCLSDPDMDVSITDISDHLDETENDVVRALKYWEKQHVLELSYDADAKINSITVPTLKKPADNHTVYEPQTSVCYFKQSSQSVTEEEPVNTASSFDTEQEEVKPEAETPAPIRPKYTMGQLLRYSEIPEYHELLNYIENRMERPLKSNELQTPAFLYETLGFTTDLIAYLYDHCISKGKCTPKYIEKIACSWDSKGIHTKEDAVTDVLLHSDACRVICESFGIKRTLGAPEIDYIRSWTGELNMSTELLKEACNRTILQTQKPDFKYANGILTKWNKAGAATLSDVSVLDRNHEEAVRKTAAAKASAPARKSTNSFTQFPQRNYTQESCDEFFRKKIRLS